MRRKPVGSAVVFMLLASALLSKAQVAPSDQKPESGVEQAGTIFPVMSLKAHGAEWKMQSGGHLTVGNGSIEFRNPKDATDLFACQISDVRSVEKRKGPMGWRVVRIQLQNGQKFDFIPDPSPFSKEAMEPIANALEKSIRDMAAAHGIVLK